MTKTIVTKSNDMHRLEVITRLLNSGYRAIHIAKIFGLSRERVRQLIYKQLTWDRLEIPCQRCGYPMETQWGLSHLYHSHCTAKIKQQRIQEQKLIRWHPRSKPDGEFEEAALAAYTKHSYEVLWMPYGAPFDYVVNGLSIDVKGAQIGKRGRWLFGMHYWTKHNNKIEMAKRCNIAHFIGKIDSSYQHFIIPSEVIGKRNPVAFYPSPQPFSCNECGAQFPTEQGLCRHQTQWCGVTPNWQQYQNNWWRLENRI